MKRFFKAARLHKLFAFTVVCMVAGGVLEFIKLSRYAEWLLTGACIIALMPIITTVWQELRNGLYGIDIIAVTAIITAVIIHQYWTGIVIVLLLSSNQIVKSYATRRARSELRDLMQRQSQQAHLLRKKQLEDVAVSTIKAGDQIVIKEGEVVPADAVILEGSGGFDESNLTGDKGPFAGEPGVEILGGSKALDGTIRAKVLRTAKDSQYQQIVRLAQAAADNPAPYVRLVDHYSVQFAIIAYTIAGVAWILSRHAIRFLDVLVVATPAPLVLAAPFALMAGMSRATREGIIVKSGSTLEKLADCRTIAFDKTGTLTEGRPEVKSIEARPPYSQNEILAYAAGLETASDHALADAILRAAAVRDIRAIKAKNVRIVNGQGLEAHANGHDVIIGSRRLLDSRQVQVPKNLNVDRDVQAAVFVAVDGRLAGYITLTDELRSDAKQTLSELRGFGVKRTVMLTGDSKVVAAGITRKLSITDVYAEALPADKLQKLEAVTDRPLAFVGDGLQDAPVLTLADVGIALNARGYIAASEPADVVIMRDRLSLVGRAFAGAKWSFHIATQSIVFGLILDVILMAVFATGKLPPLYGVIAQELVMVAVVSNALRAHRLPKKFKGSHLS